MTFASEMIITPYISASESYTDNLFLTVSEDQQSDYITQLNPGIKIRGTGNQMNLSLDYNMQNLHYSDNSDFNENRHQLAANINSELAKDIFFLDGVASFTQQAIDSFGVKDPENLTPTDNLTDVATYTVTPYFRHSFNQSTSALIQYFYGKTNYLDSTVSDNGSTNKKILAELNKKSRSERLTWLIDYRRTNIGYDNETTIDSIFERSGIEARYGIGRKTRLIASGGYESNEYANSDVNDKTSGPFWGLGVNWAPSSRTTVELILGERYLGSTGSFLLNHKTRKTSLNMS